MYLFCISCKQIVATINVPTLVDSDRRYKITERRTQHRNNMRLAQSIEDRLPLFPNNAACQCFTGIQIQDALRVGLKSVQDTPGLLRRIRR